MQISTRHTYTTLDGMRGMAAICVMIYHYNENTSLFMMGRGPIFGTAGLAVDLFFMLSGFVLSHSYADSLANNLSVQKYLAKRVIRLFPLYFAGLITGALVSIVLIESGYVRFSYNSLAKVVYFNIFYIPYPTSEFYKSFCIGSMTSCETNMAKDILFPLNPPAWSLLFEMIASFIFIYIYRLTTATLIKICATFFLFFFLCGVWAMYASGRIGFTSGLGWSSNNFIGGFPRVMFDFTLGMLLHKSARLRTLATLCLKDRVRAEMLLLLLLIMMSMPYTMRGIYSVFFLLLAAPALVSLGAEVHVRGGFVDAVCGWLGWISYPLYCIHFPVGVLVFFYGNLLFIEREVVFFCAAIASILLSIVIGHYFDAPIRALLTRRMMNMGVYSTSKDS